MEEKELIDKIKSIIDPFINDLHEWVGIQNRERKSELVSRLQEFENNLLMICTKKPLEIPMKLLDILANGGYVESTDAVLDGDGYLRGQIVFGRQMLGANNYVENRVFKKGKYRMTLIVEKIE